MLKNKLSLVCFFSALIIFSACGSQNTSYSPSVAKPQHLDESIQTAPPNAENQLYGVDGTSNEIEVTERKKIIIGDASLESTNYYNAYNQIIAYTEQSGGYVENVSSNKYESDSSYYSTSYFILRIPVDKYDEYKNLIFSVGKLKHLTENQQDVTGEYVTTTQQLELKKEEEKRLLTLLDTAQKIEDKLLIEDRLSSVQSDINVLQTKLDNLDINTSYCTLNINLTEVLQYKDAFSSSFVDRIVNALNGSFSNSIRFLQNLILGIAYVSVPLVCICVVLLVVFVFKKRKRF